MSEATVVLLADERLDALWGQSLCVGDHIVHLPEDPAPVEVPAWVGAKLVAQEGWRYAPSLVLSPTKPAPSTAPVFVPLSSKHRKKARAMARGLEVVRANRKD